MTEIGATALKLSMLYVEDEQETREFLSDSLAINYPDIQLFVASNGADGLDMYRKYRPDIVITDIRMPIIDGIGYSKESEASYGALWKAAVDATSGDVITYQNKPINVYFSSSSGGVTQKAADVWGTDFPYLTNVPDPWSLDVVLNPQYAHWLRVIGQNDMAKAFGLSDVATLKVDARSASNSALTITATSSSGKSVQLPVGVFKTKLLIPSSWFDITN